MKDENDSGCRWNERTKRDKNALLGEKVLFPQGLGVTDEQQNTDDKVRQRLLFVLECSQQLFHFLGHFFLLVVSTVPPLELEIAEVGRR
jgi:hypothetical protein